MSARFSTTGNKGSISRVGEPMVLVQGLLGLLTPIATLTEKIPPPPTLVQLSRRLT